MMALQILLHTPGWVFALLALLVGLGVQSLRTRQVRLFRILILPAFFIGWGALRLASGAAPTPALLLDWLTGLGAGAVAGIVATRLDGMRVDRNRGRVEVPGQVMPLVRNLAIFAAKYGIAVAVVLHPEQRAAIVPWDFAISGAAAGYFVGWLVRFGVIYRRAPDLAPAAGA